MMYCVLAFGDRRAVFVTAGVKAVMPFVVTFLKHAVTPPWVNDNSMLTCSSN
jgi:hypothetical protein